MVAFETRIDVRTFVWRCLVATWVRRIGFKVVKWANTIDGMSTSERWRWRQYRKYVSLREYASVRGMDTL